LLSWSSINSLTFDGSPGVDRCVVNTGLDLATLTLNGNDNNDTFTVTPSSATDIFCNGGLPTTGLNERLTLVGGGATGGIFTPNGASGGTYTFANRDPVTFTGVEVFTQPGVAPSAADLAANDDAGVSSTDNITNQTVLTFSGTGAPANNPVKLYRDGTQVASVTTASTTWTTNVTFPTGDDTYQMVVRYETTATGLLSNPSPRSRFVWTRLRRPRRNPGPQRRQRHGHQQHGQRHARQHAAVRRHRRARRPRATVLQRRARRI
jgi:hypothetical protein